VFQATEKSAVTNRSSGAWLRADVSTPGGMRWARDLLLSAGRGLGVKMGLICSIKLSVGVGLSESASAYSGRFYWRRWRVKSGTPIRLASRLIDFVGPKTIG